MWLRRTFYAVTTDCVNVCDEHGHVRAVPVEPPTDPEPFVDAEGRRFVPAPHVWVAVQVTYTAGMAVILWRWEGDFFEERTS